MTLLTSQRRNGGYDLNPFESLLNLDQLFSARGATEGEASEWVQSLPLEVSEDQDKYTVLVEVPGVEQKDIKISIDDGVLHISGERAKAVTSEGSQVHRQERYFGRFERRVALPKAVANANVTAALKNGILTVTLPKAPEAKPRVIDIAAN
jgi:HSP20 family molecular chaperone IbpA